MSHEKIDRIEMLKFPGGGLEFGEGLIDGLRREFREELKIEVGQITHLYTSEQFIQSVFRPNEQVLAIYYTLSTDNDIQDYQTVQQTRMGSSNQIAFSWETIHASLIEKLSFDTDRRALDALIKRIDGSFDGVL